MSEPNYGKDLKKICFEDSDKRHADLKIRLHYDQLKQGEFFRLMLTGYIEKDERVMNYIEEHKGDKKIQSKKKIADSKRMRNKGDALKTKLALDQGDIENIFDLLEKENPEL